MQFGQEYSLEVLAYVKKNLLNDEFLGRFSLYQLGLVDKEGRWEEGPKTGKLLRPTLLFLTMEGLGADWQRGLPVAAAVELFHNATLLVDDWQDKDTTRRGRKALWTLPEVGERQTVNIGLFLFTLSSKLITSFPEIVQSLFEETKMDVIRGQQMDIAFEERASISLEDYMKMIEFKTARLIQSSILLGAMLANVHTHLYESLSVFGKQLGLLFQLQDDYLGVFGEVESMGKPADDIAHKKKSLPVVLALKDAEGEDKSILNELYGKKETLSKDDVDVVQAIFKKLSIKKRVRELIETTYQDACTILGSISKEQFTKKEELVTVANLFANREK